MSASVTPARNRVTPTGGIVAVRGQGAWMGNRGRLHEGTGARDIVRTYQGKAWITCTLSFKDRILPQWQPGHYTQLFFFDEAVALAAGHRPCAECRRPAYNAFRLAWAGGDTPPLAPDLDAQLHLERGGGRNRHLRPMPWSGLPDGTFVVVPDGTAVVLVDRLVLWDEPNYRYGRVLQRPRAGHADVLTPPSTVSVLAAGYPVQIGVTAAG